MDQTDFEANIDQYRHKHESSVEWNLRRTFMLTHMDQYPLDRLLCLAACFVNYECYGCTYPGPVMIELKELMEPLSDVLEKHRNTITKAREIQFIKSSGEMSESYSSSFVKAGSTAEKKGKKGYDAGGASTPSSGKKKMMSFVKASDSYTSTDVGEGKSEGEAAVPGASEDATWMPKMGFGGGGGGRGKKMTGFVKAKSPNVVDITEESDDAPWKPKTSFGGGGGGGRGGGGKVMSGFVKASSSTSTEVFEIKDDGNAPWEPKMNLGGGVGGFDSFHDDVHDENEAVEEEKSLKPNRMSFTGSVSGFLQAIADDEEEHEEEAEENLPWKQPFKSSSKSSSRRGGGRMSNLKRGHQEHDVTDHVEESPPVKQQPKSILKKSPGGGVGFGGMLNVKRALQEHEEEETRSELLDKFYTLKAILPECLKKAKEHPVPGLHMAADRSKLTIMTDIKPSKHHKGQFDCLLQIDYVDIATATAPNKKTAKHNAYEQAMVEFREPYLKIVKTREGRQVLEGSQAPFSSEGLLSPSTGHHGVKAKLFESGLTGVTKLGRATVGNIHALAKDRGSMKRPQKQSLGGGGDRPLEEFLILQTAQNMSINEEFRATGILRQSGDFNKMLIDYDFRDDTVMGESRVRCLVTVQGVVMAEVEGDSNQSAKHLASQMCLERLQTMCWTLQIKQAADSDESGLSREEILGDLKKQSEAIPDSNIGNKLLKAMGWKGGGIGKDGTGIAEPVKVDSVVNREGLGLQSEEGTKDFIPAMKKIIINYVKSGKQSDLVFSPEFNRMERAMIHKECQKLGLKTRSTGVEPERYLIASRKRSPNQLFNHIMEQGGETSKYVLIPPTGGDGDVEALRNFDFSGHKSQVLDLF